MEARDGPLTTGNGQHFKAPPQKKCLCVLSSQIKETLKQRAGGSAGALCLIKVEIQRQSQFPKGSHQKVHPTL